MKTIIIAEIGINHNGSITHAKRLIDAAAKAKADFAKFQTFIAKEHITKNSPKAEYAKSGLKDNLSMLESVKQWEFNEDQHRNLISYCEKKNIKFLSSPFDISSINLLNKLKIGIIKIPSGEITNLPYLEKVGSLKKRVILSTGMSNLKEIENAIKILKRSGTPKKNITILQCNTSYPTPLSDVNLNAMIAIRERFNIEVGYSDHTIGVEAPLAAVALGARIIEKHLTLDKQDIGPDHKASMEPEDFMQMVKQIRIIETLKGSKKKICTNSEKANQIIARKSIVASTFIKKGSVFNKKNLVIKRPGLGISPMKFYKIIGLKAKKDFLEDELIEL